MENILVKKCSKCKQIKSLDLFNPSPKKYLGVNHMCKECRKSYDMKRYNLNDNIKEKYKVYSLSESARKVRRKSAIKCKEKRLWGNARDRADKKNIEFNITVEDIIIPSICPVLGIPIIRDSVGVTDNCATLDRIDNNKGYIKGNICVISYRANTLKRNGTIEEFKRIVEYMQKYIQSSPIQDNLSSKACMSRESPSTIISTSSGSSPSNTKLFSHSTQT